MARTPWTTHRRVVLARRRWPAVNTMVHAMDRFRVHRTGRNSALVAHYGFLSVFPLMLVFTTVLGFVLQNNRTLREEIIDSAISRIPIIGPQVAADPTTLQGSLLVLVLGLLAALWAGLKAFNVLQLALDDIAEVPWASRPSLVRVRVQSLWGILIIGGSQVGAAVLTSFAGISDVATINRILLAASAVALNAAVLAATYHFLCSRRPEWRSVLPGAVAGGIAFSLLQILGTTLVARAIVRATPVYGTFASVIGLITWLSLHSMIALIGAELNGVLPIKRIEVPPAPE